MPLQTVRNDRFAAFNSNPRLCNIYNNYEIKQSDRKVKNVLKSVDFFVALF